MQAFQPAPVMALLAGLRLARLSPFGVQPAGHGSTGTLS